MYKALLVISILFSAILTVAQKPLQFTFTGYSTDNGLNSNLINSVTQDEDGYIWIATADGLQRFDGIRFKTIPKIQGTGLASNSNSVFQVLKGKGKILWLLLADGTVGSFDTRTFIFSEATIKSTIGKICDLAISRLYFDFKGNLFYIRNANEILQYDSNENTFSKEACFFRLPESWIASDMVHLKGTDDYYFSIRNIGIAKYNWATATWTYREQNPGKDALFEKFRSEKNVSFYRLLIDDKKRLWFVYWPLHVPMIYCYDLVNHRSVLEGHVILQQIGEYHTIEELFQQSDGSVWIAGEQVLGKFQEKERIFQMVEMDAGSSTGIKYRLVRHLFEDKQKNIWVPSDQIGLYRFNPSQEFFKNVSHKSRRANRNGLGTLAAFQELPNSDFLVSIWSDGLYRYDRDFNEIPLNIKGIPNNNEFNIWSFALLSDSNTLLIGAQPGFFVYDIKKGSAVFYNPPGLYGRTIREIKEDRLGNIWFGLHGKGLVKWNKELAKGNFNLGFEKIEYVPDLIVSRIRIDKQNHVWVGIELKGAFEINASDKKLVAHFGADETGVFKLPDVGVSSLNIYSDTMVVITTARNIVLHNPIRRTTRVLPQPINQNSEYAAIEKDGLGNIWMSTNSGLLRYDFSSNIMFRFEKKNGIQENGFSLNASYVAKDGRLLFGADEKFVVFDPKRISRLDIAIPSVHITDIRIGEKTLLLDSVYQLNELTLGYENNSIELHLSHLNFGTGVPIFYQLEGVDKEWRVADKSAQSIYSYLAPGKYRFRMHAANINLESGPISTFVIVVTPPFWKTWWFYSVLVLFFGALLYWYDKERMKRKEAMLLMRTNIADSLHEEVNTALNNINILSEMARMKASSDPKKSIEFIEQIHSKSHSMIISLDDMLWSIDPENDSMDKTILRMREFVDALSNRYEVNIEFATDEGVRKLELNMQWRHDAFLLFKEVMQALIKAGIRNYSIHLGPDKMNLLYSIQFNTEETDRQQLNNLLHSQEVQTRSSKIEAILEIDIHKSSSMVSIRIPIKQEQ